MYTIYFVQFYLNYNILFFALDATRDIKKTLHPVFNKNKGARDIMGTLSTGVVVKNEHKNLFLLCFF